MSPEVLSTPVAETAKTGERSRSRARAARRRKAVVTSARVLVLVAVLGLWEALSRAKLIDPFNFSMPSQIWDQIWTWITHGTALGSLGEQIWYTLYEALLGWVFGVVAGVVLGIALGRVRFLADVLGPYIKVLNSIPRIVLAPIFVIWFGFGFTPKILIAALLGFFPVVVNTARGLRAVDPEMVQYLRTLGASTTVIFLRLRLPASLPYLMASAKVSISLATVGAVVGEFIGASQGLGYVILRAINNFDTTTMFAALLLVSVIGVISYGVIALVERRMLSWQPDDVAAAESA